MSELPVCIAEVKNTLGECPVWDELEQVLYWVDITERVIHRYNPATNEIIKWDTPSEFGAISLRSNGLGLIAGTKNGFSLFNMIDGTLEELGNPEIDLDENRMNDGKCDPCGRFWCGSIHEVSDPSLRQPIAAIYRVDTDLKITRVKTGIKTSNGFAWSPDGKTMYFTDTPTLEILAFDYNLDDGTISNERVFATVSPGSGRPDGAAVDANGCLWSAHFAGARITQYSPEGKAIQVVEMPVANVTSCTFGGKDLSTLFITTAREDLSQIELERQPLAGGLFAFSAGVAGLSMNRFAG